MSSQHAFVFIQALADDVNSRKLTLPSFPNVATQIRNALNDDNCTADKLAIIISREPKLAACLLKLSNSAQYSRGNRTVDVPSAINRLGLKVVQNTAMTVAMRQLELEKDYLAITEQLQPLLQHSVNVAAIAHTLARRQKGVNADSALLAGMMHGIGKVYIWSRASQNEELFSDTATMDELLTAWHCPVGKSILESWCLPEDMVAAVEHYQHYEDASQSEYAKMVATLSVADLLAANDDPNTLDEISELPEYKRLGIEEASISEFLAAANDDIQSLRSAMS
ncbi:MAG: HDOD domain-containing protein [Pseudomonadales bacterium]